ncbi:unnamed protein product [Adineta steineri]|uniref:Uncharacterized protein n=1 Tax=Adineta steineri TaxID=433720 RepID=A0A813WXB0_9BILA|nr:unnamed protein product [Adineta steineri]CAF1478632.1 unnamed protein product [Adineta steineri]
MLGTVRTLTTDDKQPASGFELRKGESVVISFYVLARDQRYCSHSYDLNGTEHKKYLSGLIAFRCSDQQYMDSDLARLMQDLYNL